MYKTFPFPFNLGSWGRKKGLKRLTACIAFNGTPITELWDFICPMGSHSVTCYPTQVNAPYPNPSLQAGTQLT